MKKILNNWFINALLALIAVFGVAIQEVSINDSIMPVVGIGVFAALGASLLGEFIKILVCKADFSKKQYFIGTGIGWVAGIILAILTLY